VRRNQPRARHGRRVGLSGTPPSSLAFFGCYNFTENDASANEADGSWGLRRHVGTLLRELARRRECQIEEGQVLPDHVHMLISITYEETTHHSNRQEHVQSIRAGMATSGEFPEALHRYFRAADLERPMK
jgi:hypothetical protein